MAEATVAAPQNVMRDLKIEKLVISKLERSSISLFISKNGMGGVGYRQF
jgi:hypothetical protein